MVSAVMALCDEYVSRYAELDPVYGWGRGIGGDLGAVTDYGPDGIAARADLVRGTLARLDAPAADAALWPSADRLAAAHLRERLSAELARHELDEPATGCPGSPASGVSGHSEGWAVYAERLADELGWFSAPGTRLGTLLIRARQAARVAIDNGLHLDLPVPSPDAARHDPQWTFEVAVDVLATRGRCVPHRLTNEVVRYCGMPGQATGYKLGERAWLSAREEARARDGAAFDLRRWHAAALDVGPIGLGLLPSAPREAGTARVAG